MSVDLTDEEWESFGWGSTPEGMNPDGCMSGVRAQCTSTPVFEMLFGCDSGYFRRNRLCAICAIQAAWATSKRNPDRGDIGCAPCYAKDGTWHDVQLITFRPLKNGSGARPRPEVRELGDWKEDAS